MANKSHNDAHNDLVRDTLQELAINGYTAWPNQTGVWFDEGKGRPHKFGKKGSADIVIILPVMVLTAAGVKRLIGWHVEAEAKTGKGKQNKNQELHQEFCVERNGGAYILFRDTPHLLAELKLLKNI